MNETICRCCGKPMPDGGTQELHPKQIAAGKKPITYITCWNADCAMEGYTFSKARYATEDLTPYLAKC